MKLSQLFDQLVYGELKAFKIGGADSEDGLSTSDYPALVAHTNLALSALHARFPIRRETVHIQQHAEISSYVLDLEYAASNTDGAQPTKYIIDSVEDPYQDNLIKIDEVTDEDGCRYALNIIDDCKSLTTPIHNVINVPFPVDTNVMIVKYRANHPYISPAGIVPANTNIQIPDYLTRAFTLFIAERVLATQTSLGAIQAAQSYERKYEVECQRIDALGLFNKEDIVTNFGVDQWA